MSKPLSGLTADRSVGSAAEEFFIDAHVVSPETTQDRDTGELAGSFRADSSCTLCLFIIHLYFISQIKIFSIFHGSSDASDQMFNHVIKGASEVSARFDVKNSFFLHLLGESENNSGNGMSIRRQLYGYQQVVRGEFLQIWGERRRMLVDDCKWSRTFKSSPRANSSMNILLTIFGWSLVLPFLPRVCWRSSSIPPEQTVHPGV